MLIQPGGPVSSRSLGRGASPPAAATLHSRSVLRDRAALAQPSACARTQLSVSATEHALSLGSLHVRQIRKSASALASAHEAASRARLLSRIWTRVKRTVSRGIAPEELSSLRLQGRCARCTAIQTSRHSASRPASVPDALTDRRALVVRAPDRNDPRRGSVACYAGCSEKYYVNDFDGGGWACPWAERAWAWQDLIGEL
ncbi:hypothetical protein OBBRIDRAFT_840345 [Obba rivulosa]|uniref:Uncharacterized protein n=1 Tax=Obba rivulosa TaxID=1052685 RepID=A0A8E2AFP9_9APHY|nr:hypothetical protein OBBRIDRAFT_840345 [Obba rivulosa]